jgi:hypothetical protein
VLLVLFPAVATAYLVAIRSSLVPARPALVWLLAALPLELALCVPLHGLVTFLHAWRLD